MYSREAAPSPWLSASTAKAKTPSLGFPREELPSLDTARDDPGSFSSMARRQWLPTGAFPKATLIKVNLADV